MWEDVASDNTSLVQEAFDVISQYHDTWGSSSHLASWLEQENVRVRYWKENQNEAAFVLRFNDNDSEWEVTAVSGRGTDDEVVISQMIDGAVDFMKEEQAGTLVAYTSKAIPSQYSEWMASAIDIVENHSDIESLEATELSKKTRYRAFLRPGLLIS
jgi:hypothetical protein